MEEGLELAQEQPLAVVLVFGVELASGPGLEQPEALVLAHLVEQLAMLLVSVLVCRGCPWT